jgi:hypothetical protein
MRSHETLKAFQLPLHLTALCLDCEMCFDMGAGRCPACGGGMWASVARFLHGRYQP